VDKGRLRILTMFLVLALGAAGSLFAYRTISRQAEAVALLQYRAAVDGFAREFSEYIRTQGRLANAFAGLMTVAPDTTQAGFDDFSARVSPSYPSVVAVSWLPRVSPDGIAEVEHRLAAIATPAPRVHSADGTVITPDGLNRDVFPVVLSSPGETNHLVLGIDAASSPERLSALERARDTGAYVSSEPVMLIRLPGVKGLNLYVPVFRPGVDTGNIEARRQALTGFVSVTYRLDFLVRDAFSQPPRLFQVHLFDAEAPAGQRGLASVGPDGGLKEPSEHLLGNAELVQRQVVWGQRHWSLVFEPMPAALSPVSQQARLAFIVGMEITLVLAGYLHSLDRTRRHMRRAHERLRSVADALAQADRRKSELLAQWNALMENAPVGFAFFDRQYRYVQVNSALAELNGIAAADHIGRKITDLLPRHAGIVCPLVDEVFATGGSRHGLEIQVEAPSQLGVERHWLTSWFPVVVNGETVSVGTVILEITARKRAEADMLAAKDAADRANLAKSKFLAAASHDLRQPMQSLFFFSAALNAQVQGEKARATLAMLDRGLETLKALLDSLLDMSRLDAGVVKASIEDFDIGPWLEHMRSSYEPVAQAKGLEFRIDDICHLMVRSDQNLLGRMVRNLIENAIRYTSAGFIRLGCHAEDGWVVIEVSDSGIGIPADHLERIWEEFHQVGNQGRDRSQGLGLGLAIVRRLSHLLSHPVEVSSRPGLGTTFTLRVPAGAEPPPA
jgi:PAS domain S-box-containing protein